MKGLLAAALLLAGCVSLEEQMIPKNAIAPDQRTLLLVYAAPGPIFIEDDSKVETAAKIVPGLGLVVKSAQDDSETKKSKALAQYLPQWDPAGEFAPMLAKELKNSSGHPGAFIDTSTVDGLSDAQLKVYNRSADVLDWQLKYYIDNPERPVPRNYSTLLTLDDALIIDANLAWQLAVGDEDKATPALALVTRLVRAGSSHTIWRHEDVVSDAAGARTTYEFMQDPNDLIAKYRKLMPTLAQTAVATYRRQLQQAGLFKMPTNAVMPYAAPSSSPPETMPYGMSPSTAPADPALHPPEGGVNVSTSPR